MNKCHSILNFCDFNFDCSYYIGLEINRYYVEGFYYPDDHKYMVSDSPLILRMPYQRHIIHMSIKQIAKTEIFLPATLITEILPG